MALSTLQEQLNKMRKHAADLERRTDKLERKIARQDKKFGKYSAKVLKRAYKEYHDALRSDKQWDIPSPSYAKRQDIINVFDCIALKKLLLLTTRARLG